MRESAEPSQRTTMRRRMIVMALMWWLAEVGAFEDPAPIFPFGQHDEALEAGMQGREMRLSFPITVGSQYYSNVHVNEDGLVSFGHPYPSYIMALELIHTPCVAAFFSDINETAFTGGKVFFREETQNTDDLIRFDSLVLEHFGEEVQTKSLVVVTWFKVAPNTWQDREHFGSRRHFYTDPNRTAEKNTFQLAIGSSEGRSFVAMSYPRGALGWAQSVSASTGGNWAQAAINDGQGKIITFKESGGPRMLTLDRRSNVGKEGLFMFRLGSSLEGPPPSPASLSASTARMTCDINPDPCHPRALCTNLDTGDSLASAAGESSAEQNVPPGRAFCCACAHGTVGDGYLCLDESAIPAYRIVGRIEGDLKGRPIGPFDLYGVANGSSGITYLALTADQTGLANDFQGLFAASGGIHWLFGKTPLGGKSGFLLSGGRLNRTAEVTFLKDGSHLTIEESFYGLTFDNMIRVKTVVTGNLPTIRPGLRVQVPEYINVFHRTRPGELRSNSTQQLQFSTESSDGHPRSLEFSEEPLAYNVQQTIRFEENPCDEDLLEDPYKVIVNRASIRTDQRIAPARVHMQAEVDIRVGKLATDPCDNADCGDALCVPNGDSDYRCLCDQGAEFRRGRCVHVTSQVRSCADSSIAAMCPRHARCIDSAQGPFCRCDRGFRETSNRICEPVADQGYTTRGYTTFPVEAPQGRGVTPPEAGPMPPTCSQPCHRMASCVPSGTHFVCLCMQGTVGDGVSDCRPITCHDDPRLCPAGAHCVSASCRCLPGYVGDGSHCSKEEKLDRFSNADGDLLIYSRGMTILELPAIPSGQTPARLLALGDDTSEIVGVAVDCDHEHIYWTDSINGKIFRSRIDGKNTEEVLSGLKQPEGIAVDPSSRNVFWVDSELGRIQVASMDNFAHTYTLLGDDLDNPRGIAIHPQRGKVYFTERSLDYPRIGSVSMDGTERRTLVDTELEVPNMLAVDPESEELCWTDGGRKTIECVSLLPSVVTGQGHRRVVYRSDALRSKMFGIAMHQKRIYWTDWEIPVVHMLDRTNSSGNSLQPSRFLPITGGGSRLYSLAIAPKHCPRVRTSCEVRRGDCPYMCLPTDSYGRSCVCPDALREIGQCPSAQPLNVVPPQFSTTQIY